MLARSTKSAPALDKAKGGKRVDNLEKEKHMTTWLRWLIVITQVGGGFTGIAITLGYLQNSGSTPPSGLIIPVGFIGLYLFVILAGALFAHDERRTRLLRAAFWLQIPLISSPIIAWGFSAGFSLNLTLIGSELGANFWLGSFWQFFLFGELPWGVGINLFAVLMLFLLGRTQVPQAESAPSVAAQIDSILQSRLLNTHLADRGIRLQSLPEGDMSIAVGLDHYVSVEDVPEEEIKSFIRSAVDEWVRRKSSNC